MTPAGAEIVGRKKSESRRYNTLVRMDDELVEICKKVAALKGISMAEYIKEVLMPIAKRDLSKEAKKITKEGGPE